MDLEAITLVERLKYSEKKTNIGNNFPRSHLVNSEAQKCQDQINREGIRTGTTLYPYARGG